MIKRVVTIVLVVAVLGIAISDTYRYAVVQQRLRSTTYDLATWAAQNSSSFDRDEMARKLAATAAQEGVTVYQYDQTENSVRVWTQAEVRDTIVIGAVVNLMRGQDPSDSTGSTFTLRDYREAGAQ